MRVRISSAFMSSVIFTVALISIIPAFWANVLTSKDRTWLAPLDDGYRAAAKAMSDLSVASLAMIFVSLIVVWAGYAKRARWAWFAMFTVVWVWAFPLLLLPLFRCRFDVTLSEWLYDAIYYSGSRRIWARSVLIFLLMAAALVLPMRSFFFARRTEEPHRQLTAKFLCLSAIGLFIVAAAALSWIRVGAVYELPPAELNTTQRLPPPVAPSDKTQTRKSAARALCRRLLPPGLTVPPAPARAPLSQP